MIHSRIKYTKYRLRMSIIFLTVFSVIGCSTAFCSEDTLSLNNNRLTVKVVFNYKGDVSQAKHPYGLYRLVVCKEEKIRDGYRTRLGIVRIHSKQGSYLVERQPVATAQPIDNIVTFELPLLEGPGTCYTVVSIGSFAMPYSHGGDVSETYFIDLKAYHDNVSSLKKVRTLNAELENSLSSKQVLLSNLDRAYSELKQNRAYVNGECTLPTMGTLPPCPEGAHSYDEAEEIAHQVVFQYLAGRIGCQSVQLIFKDRSFKRFLDQFDCGDKSYLRYVRLDEYQTLLDAVEAVLLNCKEESKDTCMTLYGGIVMVRALYFINEITHRLYSPYESWQKIVHRIQSEPKDTLRQCSSALTLWSNRDQTVAMADEKIAMSRQSLAVAEKTVNRNLTLSTRELVCHKDASFFLNSDRGAVFVAPPIH